MKNELRRMVGHYDYDCWGGVESFNDDSAPFIYEQEFNDGEVDLTVIADKNGIQICLSTLKGSENWVVDTELSSMRAEGWMRALIKEFEKYSYAPDLAYAIDHDEVFKDFNYIGEN